jgi:nucleoside-diphosphate-sugar epimerase
VARPSDSRSKKVFLTGAEGYIGSLLGPYLMDRGYEVTGVDTGYYRDGILYDTGGESRPRLLDQDIRRLTLENLCGFDAVVHLADLSNDPSGELNPLTTREINHFGAVHLAKLGREAGVSRFVYASSCSVYGRGSSDLVTEESDPDPQTEYARCKVRVERDLSALASAEFSPTFLRNATAFGASPRQRFDVVLNNLAGWAWTEGEVRLTSDGKPWRPLVHVLDICHAIECVLAAPTNVVNGEIFNVGHTGHNYRIREIAEIVADVFSGSKVVLAGADSDRRSYRVSFEKISERLPGWKLNWDVRSGALQLKRLFEQIGMPKHVFHSRPFTRREQLKYLLATYQIDDSFFWRKPHPTPRASAATESLIVAP